MSWETRSKWPPEARAARKALAGETSTDPPKGQRTLEVTGSMGSETSQGK